MLTAGARRRVADGGHSHAVRDEVGRRISIAGRVYAASRTGTGSRPTSMPIRSRAFAPSGGGLSARAGQPGLALPRRQCRRRRLRRQGPVVVVQVDPRPGDLVAAGELSGPAPRDALDELRRQGHVPRRARQHARRLRTARAQPSAASTRSVRVRPAASCQRRHRHQREPPIQPRTSATPWVWKGEWDAVLNDSLLFEVRVGQFAGEQDLSPVARHRGSRTSTRCSSAAAIATGTPARAATSCSARSATSRTAGGAAITSRSAVKPSGSSCARTWLTGYPGERAARAAERPVPRRSFSSTSRRRRRLACGATRRTHRTRGG